MILVVSDTSPLTALIQVGQISILQRLYEEVLVPEAVWLELRHKHTELPRFIQTRTVTESPALTARRRLLDEGEACAITLAEQIHADLLLIDEKKGRAVAEQTGLHYIGLAGVLIEARRRGVIPLLRPLLDQLVNEAGFRLSGQVYAAVLAQVGEA